MSVVSEFEFHHNIYNTDISNKLIQKHINIVSLYIEHHRFTISQPHAPAYKLAKCSIDWLEAIFKIT